MTGPNRKKLFRPILTCSSGSADGGVEQKIAVRDPGKRDEEIDMQREKEHPAVSRRSAGAIDVLDKLLERGLDAIDGQVWKRHSVLMTHPERRELTTCGQQRQGNTLDMVQQGIAMKSSRQRANLSWAETNRPVPFHNRLLS